MNNFELPICQYVSNAKDIRAHDCNATMVSMLFKSVETSLLYNIEQLRYATNLTTQDRNRLKQDLPAICWSAFFKDGKRHAESAESSGLVCMDIDLDMSQMPEGSTPLQYCRQYYQEHFGGREAELDIVFAHISPSAKGLHVVYLAQEGLTTIHDNNLWLSSKTGCIFDEACKDLGRMMYVSLPDDILYDNTYALYED